MGNVRGWVRACLAGAFFLSTAVAALGNPMPPAQAVNEGKALGSAKVSSTTVNEALRASGVPPAPPPRDCVPPVANVQGAYGGGNGNLIGAATPLLGSAAAGTSQECNAIAFMQGKSAAPNPVSINPGDPLLVKGNGVQLNPMPGLGSIGGIFIERPAAAACQPGTVTVGGNGSQEQCYEYAEAVSGTCSRDVEFEIERWWDYQCSKTVSGTTTGTCDRHWEVDVAPGGNSCVEGSVLHSFYIPFVAYNDINAQQLVMVAGLEVEFICRNALIENSQMAVRVRSSPFGTMPFDFWGYPDLSGYAWEPEQVVSAGTALLKDFGPLGAQIWVTTQIIEQQVINPSKDYYFGFSQQLSWLPEPNTYLTILNVSDGLPTITRDELVDACGAFSTNQSCSPAGEVCVEGVNETRVINGLSVTKPCWRYMATYQCSSAGSGGTCAPLEAQPLCTQTGAGTCTEYSLSGECLTRTTPFRCTKDMGPPAGVTSVGNGYNVIKDSINETACATKKGNPNCSLVERTCTDSADKVFDGFTFSKSCWQWEDTYLCGEMAGAQNCSVLDAQGCTPIVGSKACTTLLPDGSCGVYSTMYQCGAPAQTVTTGSTCDTTPYCFNGVCYEQARPGDPDFGKSVAMMEVGRQAGVYLEQDKLTVFNGGASFCRRKLFGLNNCCKPNSGSGTNWANSAAMQAMKFGVNFIGSYNVYDMLFAGETDFIVQAAFGMGDFNTGTTTSIYGFQFSIINGDIVFLGFDPWSFAIQVALQIVVQELTSCPDSDKLTATRRAQGICGHIGEFCSSKFLGICKTKKESYCCFNSKLAKAITMQGKAQLGKSLGDARNPNCDGLTADEISSLDFSQIDLSEFIADLVTNPITDAQATNSVVERLSGYAPVAPDYANSPSVASGYTPAAPKPPTPPLPPDPTVTAVFAPSPVRHGQPFTLQTNTTNADTLSYECSGFMTMSGTIAVGVQTTSFTAPNVGWGQTDCLITVENAASDITIQVSFQVFPPAPTVTASLSPGSVMPGDNFQVNYSVANADKLTYSCSGGIVTAGELPVQGTVGGPWVAPESYGSMICVLTAKHTGTNETATTTTTMTINEPLPVITASFTPASVPVGQVSNLVTSISSASSASLACTGAFVLNTSLSVPTDAVAFTATVGNVGTAVCTITAVSVTGQPVNVSRSLVVTP